MWGSLFLELFLKNWDPIKDANEVDLTILIGIKGLIKQLKNLYLILTRVTLNKQV